MNYRLETSITEKDAELPGLLTLVELFDAGVSNKAPKEASDIEMESGSTEKVR